MQFIGLFDRNSVTNSPKTYQCRRTIRPLCRIIVCLVQTHIEAGEQVGKTEIHLHVSDALKSRVPLLKGTNHFSSSHPFSPSQRSGMNLCGSGKISGLSWMVLIA
ncbi:hypothetical protein CCHR01_01023 [Colletotrichum chrysophilum]|uniref:Uncharacterized protein n=1 Tax=Colletotrichum chrysophilum TaxID=1836956 RepID=A0AAD9EPJ1_9PEZI|nr:hypothetical protein CCHR01_01023 [Colletotrichum chrysophilum]